MAERNIERYLRQRVELYGGMCEKFKAPGRRNVPDRICSWPFGEIDLVECKDGGKKPRIGQLRDHARRKKLGKEVWIIDAKWKVDDYIYFCLERQRKKANQ